MVKVTPRSNCKCLTFYRQAGGGPSTERHSCLLEYSFTQSRFGGKHVSKALVHS